MPTNESILSEFDRMLEESEPAILAEDDVRRTGALPASARIPFPIDPEVAARPQRKDIA